MKFVFPKNYNFKSKLFGFIDYQTVAINALWALILYGLSNLIFSSINYKIYFFVVLYFPLFLFSIFGFQHESFITVIKYIYRFFKERGIYLYKKSNIQTNERSNIKRKYIKQIVEIFDFLL